MQLNSEVGNDTSQSRNLSDMKKCDMTWQCHGDTIGVIPIFQIWKFKKIKQNLKKKKEFQKKIKDI